MKRSMHCWPSPRVVAVGARPSPLSQAQVREVGAALQRHHPGVELALNLIPTVGDRRLDISLRSLGRTNFFTKEIDEWVLQGQGRVGIHSAKDLPSPLAEGLVLFCLACSVDPSDSLVLRPSECLESLPSGARIATSSIRREERVRELRGDLCFCDLRGTIEERLAKLERGEADGVVVAEAALIRLGLCHLNRLRLSGPTVEGQGQLAVVGRAEDEEIRALFRPLAEVPDF